MIEREHPELSVRRQAALLGINRNRLAPRPKVGKQDEAIMRAMDEIHSLLSGGAG